jgi:putative CocE/NonD family hydrolase
MQLAFIAVAITLAAPSCEAAARYVSEAKYKAKVIKYLPVRMRDGVELGVKITRPDAEGKFPAIVSYNPYRSLSRSVSPAGYEYIGANMGAADAKVPGDPRLYPEYFAERGYAMVEFDVRGTGNSGGFSADQYSKDELQDGYDMVEWIATQPWSNGNVGMWGISYGGVDTWQIAAAAPPHLKAVIVRAGTDDVFTDWTYPGGVPRGLYIYGVYGSNIIAQNFAPPDIELVGAKWADMWEEHLQRNVPWTIGWIQHQLDSPYWRDRSVRPNYDRIKCAVFVIAGWQDWYATAELRAFEHLKGPKKALVGPWAHYWPELALPGPRLDGRSEYMRWWDQWLKGTDTGVMNDPPVTIFVRQYKAPGSLYIEDKGFWRQEKEWPPARTEKRAMYLSAGGGLGREPEASDQDRADSYAYNPAAGVMNAIYGLGGTQPWGLPLDQRADETYSLTYTTPPLTADLEVTGNPEAELYVSSSADIAFFEVKLCDVAPDGVSKLITSGGLNATHRDSHSHPQLLTPGQVYAMKIPLDSLAYVFPAGHRIRVDVSSADFQNAWPVSKNAMNALHHGRKYLSRVILPVAPEQNPRLPLPDLMASPNPLPKPGDVQKAGKTVTQDLVNQTTSITVGTGAHISTFTVSSANPANAVAKGSNVYSVNRGGADIQVATQCTTTSDEATFRHMVEVEVTVNGKRHFNKSWSVVVPREFN